MAIRIQRRLHDEVVVKSNVDGEPDTKLICGRLCFEHAHYNMVLVALPPVMVLGPPTDVTLGASDASSRQFGPSSKKIGSAPPPSRRVWRVH